MKLYYLVIILMAIPSKAFLQNIKEAPPGKSVVYFMRPSSMGSLISNFIHDGDKIIGKLQGSQYFRYECLYGEHVFWARSENRSYIKANLEEGKIYIVEVRPLFGLVRNGVQLIPIKPLEAKLKKFQKLLFEWDARQFDESKLESWNNKSRLVIQTGMKRFDKMEAKGFSFEKIEPNMAVTPKDLIYQKKNKKRE